MRQDALSLVLGIVSVVGAAEDLTRHQHAVAAIRALGGTVDEGNRPGAPVRIGLTGSRSPRDCMPHLKSVLHLHTLDL